MAALPLIIKRANVLKQLNKTVRIRAGQSSRECCTRRRDVFDAPHHFSRAWHQHTETWHMAQEWSYLTAGATATVEPYREPHSLP